MAGFEDGLRGAELAEGGEELVGEAFVECQLRWELDEQRAEFFAEALDLIEEGLQQCAGVDELGLMRDGLRNFDGELEVRWGGCGPALPGLEHVRAVKAGVDFDAVEAGGGALEV